MRYDEEPFGLAPDEAAAGYALACQAQPLGDLVISTARDDEACAEPARHRAVVRAVRPLSADVLHVELELPEAGTLDYRPGQYLKLAAGDGLARSFSMASVPREGRVDLHVRRIPGGAFTDGILPRLKAGDPVDVELPLGTFSIARRLPAIADGCHRYGTGADQGDPRIADGRSRLPPVSLYWGMRQPEDLYLHADIPTWGERLYDFQYVPVLSRAGDGWQGRRGYVHDAALADLGDLSEHAIYLCGSRT